MLARYLESIRPTLAEVCASNDLEFSKLVIREGRDWNRNCYIFDLIYDDYKYTVSWSREDIVNSRCPEDMIQDALCYGIYGLREAIWKRREAQLVDLTPSILNDPARIVDSIERGRQPKRRLIEL